MEDIWKRAKIFAEEAAKRSQTITNSVSISDLVSETAKKSKELAAEASKKADQIKTAALKQADQIQIKSISLSLPDIIPPQLSSLSVASSSAPAADSQSELQKFGVTDDLREFVKGLTAITFRNFPMQDAEEAEASDVATTASNVRKDLSEWQEKHATVVLTTVKGCYFNHFLTFLIGEMEIPSEKPEGDVKNGEYGNGYSVAAAARVFD